MVTNTQRALVIGLVAAGAIFVCLFGARTLRALRGFREHRPPPVFSEMSEEPKTDVELIRDWMTVPFIAKMYRVSPSALFKALEIQPGGNQEKSLRQLNEEYFPGSPGVVEAKIKAAVLENLPPPTPSPSP